MELQLLENFTDENTYNLTENGAYAAQKHQSIAAGTKFVNLLSWKNPEENSIQHYLAQFY